MQLIMESFRKFVIEEQISQHIKKTDHLTEKQLRIFVVEQYAKKNITLSEQQLNEIMPKWLKMIAAKAAMLGTVGSLAMGSVAQAGVISDIPVTAADGSEASYTLTADEIQGLADVINELPDQPEDAQGEDIKKHAQGLEKVADHPSADISYDDLSAGELRQALKIWAQDAYDAKNAPEDAGEHTELEKLRHAAAEGSETAIQRLRIIATSGDAEQKIEARRILDRLQQDV